MAYPMPTVIEKTRTTNLGGDTFTRKQLGAEIAIQSKADLHSMLVGISREDTAQQIRLGNPPQLVVVDNMTDKPVESVERKVVVMFGTVLARAAMAMVEAELQKAITRTTTARSNRLSNVRSSWEWRFIPKGGITRIVTAANPPTSFAQGDKLVLVPVAVPYASAVNRAIANSGRLKGAERGRKRGSKATSSIGFLAAATAAVRRRPDFKQFSVMAQFTQAHAVPGEVYSHGTGIITIRPRFRQMKV